MATGTVTAGNSTTLSLSGDQTVLITTVHNTVGRVRFAATQTDGSPPSDAGGGIGFGPLATSKTYGPFGIVGTLTITCESGTVTYTSSDSTTGQGNLGVGVVPSAVNSNMNMLQIGAYGVLNNYSGASQVDFNSNCYYNTLGAYTFLNTGPATVFRQQSGAFTWFNAAAGAAGTAPSFVQAMTLDANSNLLLGTTTSALSNVNGQIITPVGQTYIEHASGVASGSTYIGFAYNAGIIGSVTQNGTTGVLFNITSDARVKENIADAASASLLIDSIQVRQFDFKSDGSHSRYGFIAQELVEVVPEAVHVPADDTEMMGVDFSKLVPLLVKEVQELRARVAVLEGK